MCFSTMNFSAPAASKPQSSMKRFSINQVAICLLLALVTVGAYWGSFPGAFHFDDLPLMLENPRVTSPSFDYGSFVEMYGGRPLTLWTFHLNYRWFGADPAAFHVVNVALHVLAGILLYLLIFQWKGQHVPAFGAALIFILHPAQAQIVDYVWGRSLLLMAVFGLGALLLVRRHPWWALVMLQLAVWSRAEALVFLAPLVLMDRRILKSGLLLAVVDLGCFIYGFLLVSPAEFGWNYAGWLQFWRHSPLVLLRYLGWMIWPGRFSVFHGTSPLDLASLLAGAAALAGLILLTLVARRRVRTAWVGLGWAVLFLLPSVLVPNTEPFSESRVYVALAGIAVAVSWLIWRADQVLAGRVRSRIPSHSVAAGVLAVALISGFLATQDRHRVWADDVALWHEAVDREPDAVLPNYNLAVALSNRGRTAEACTYFARSLDLNPQDDMSYSGLGYCAEVNGRIDQAAEFYTQALSLNTGNDYAREGLHRLEAKRISDEETRP